MSTSILRPTHPHAVTTGSPYNFLVSAVVPAYNEEERIGEVLDTLSTYLGFAEILVVDRSTDGTKRVVEKYANVRYLRQEGEGKGQAMDQGVRAAQGAIIFFCDADISGLSHATIDSILEPVLTGHVDMCVDVRGRRVRHLTAFFAHSFPLTTLVGGERAVRRSLWEKLPDAHKSGFGIEQALNFYAAHYGRGFTFRASPRIRQKIKEQKYGLLAGFERRCMMVGEMLSVRWKLEYEHAKERLQKKKFVTPSPRIFWDE